MTQWYRDGIAIDDADLGDLAATDGEALCEFDGVRLRFTAETIARSPTRPADSTAALLTLRQVDGSPGADPIYLADFADTAGLDVPHCARRQCGQLADAQAIAERTARRYVCAELFHRAQGIIGGDRAA